MRDLSPQEEEARDRRRAALEDILNERMPVLADFAERLGIKPGAAVVADPERFLTAFDEVLRDIEVGDDAGDRAWLLARVAYYVGELLIQRHGGYWFLNEIPGSRFFLQYVVGGFNGLNNPALQVDPFLTAMIFVDSPPGRHLTALMEEIERDFAKA